MVLEQFCGKLGLRVPKDLSIVSFNNSLFSRITSPQLTTVDVNPYQLGMEAASQTINHLFSREAERPRFAYFFRYSRGVMPKCALNARLK